MPKGSVKGRSTKANLLLNKFCKDVERLYGKSVVTPNMHLHGHIAECIEDYGSVYGFWLFSYERYNGILGSFPTNKRDRFIIECECSQQPLPEMFTEYFKTLAPFNAIYDAYQSGIPRSLTNCHDMSQMHVPTCGITVALNSDDYDNLVYRHL